MRGASEKKKDFPPPLEGWSLRSIEGKAISLALVTFLAIGFFIILLFATLFLRPVNDRGVRLWLLNHAPDQLIIANPDTGEIEKELLIADGLVQLIFNHRKDTAYIANVVDVSNRLTVVDTRTYLKNETIILDGVPQGLSIFADDIKLAVISGSKTDFEAGGFDVIDLSTPSEVDPRRRQVLYRERGLSLTSAIHVDENGLIYCLDSRDSRVFIFDYAKKKLVHSVDIGSAPMYLLFPEKGKYFFVTSVKDESITFFNKDKDPKKIDKVATVKFMRFRRIAANSDASIIYAPSTEKKIVAVIDVAKRKVTATFPIPEGSEVMAVSPFDDEIYPIGVETGKVYVLDARTGALKREIPTKGEFRDVAVLLESEKPPL